MHQLTFVGVATTLREMSIRQDLPEFVEFQELMNMDEEMHSPGPFQAFVSFPLRLYI